MKLNKIGLRTLATCTLFLHALTFSWLNAAEAPPPNPAKSVSQPNVATNDGKQIEALAGTLHTLKQEIDALQIEQAKESRPWYKDAATIIAILSFIFAFGTTWVSNSKAKAQEIEAHRTELRGLLQRMAALPKENLEASEKYASNPAALATVSGYLNQENTFLSGQAAEIVKRLPAGRVSAVEYYAIALGMSAAYNLEGQRKFLAHAIAAATDFNTEIAAVRMNAHVLFQTDKPDTGRAEYQKALAIFDKYPGYDDYTQLATRVKTEITWAFSETFVRAGSPLAEQHLGQAEACVAPAPASPGRDQLEKDINQARHLMRLPAAVPGAEAKRV